MRPGDDEGEKGWSPLSLTVFYCGHCGTVIGPAGDADTVLSVPAARTVENETGAFYMGRVARGVAEPLRRFPDELLAPVPLEDVPPGSRVDLRYYTNHVIRGTVAGAAAAADRPGGLSPRPGGRQVG